MKSLKKALVLVLSLILVISAIPFTAFAETTAQATEGWTKISTADELLAMEGSTGNFYLANDIDMSKATSDKVVDGVYTDKWVLQKFDGVLEGNGYTVYNFKLVANKEENETVRPAFISEFGDANSNNAIIRNLQLGTKEAPIIADITVHSTSAQYFGFLAGRGGPDDYRVLVENVKIYGEATFSGSSEKGLFAGGLVGNSKSITMKDCEFHGSMTDERETVSECNIAGMISQIELNVNSGKSIIKNCANYANLEDTNDADGKTDRLAGIGNHVRGTVLIQNCANYGKITNGNQSANIVSYIYNKKDDYSNVQKTIIKDCGYGGNSNLTKYVASKSGNQNNKTNPFYYIYNEVDTEKENTAVTEISDLAGLQAIKDDPTGIYRLTNDINLEENSEAKIFQNYIINCDFGGVLDGDGYSIYNFKLEATEANDAGLIFTASNATNTDSAILDLTVGSPECKVEITGGGRNGSYGALLSKAGANKYGPIISGITTYVDMKITKAEAQSTNAGGIVGNNVSGVYTDCVAYGSITVDGIAGEDETMSYTEAYSDAGGIAGRSEGAYKHGAVTFLDCISLVDISVTSNYDSTDGAEGADDSQGGAKKRVGGVVGTTNKALVIANCVNLGDLTVNGTHAEGDDGCTTAGGAIGQATANVVIMDSINLGNISAESGLAAGCVGASNATTKLFNNKQVGSVSGAEMNEGANMFDFAETPTYMLQAYNNAKGAALTMGKGASVRLNEPAGIRFTANCDADVLAVIEKVADYDIETKSSAISYGMLIAPAKFVREVDDFTKAALDEYGKTLDEGVPAYVDVPSNGNFQEVKGKIAGSLVDVDEQKDVLFTGRAYVSFTAGGESYIFYAEGAKERSISGVATEAYNDYLYEKDGAYYQYDAETSEYVLYGGSDASDYSEELDTVDGYKKLSPYDANERAVLAGFAGITVEG